MSACSDPEGGAGEQWLVGPADAEHLNPLHRLSSPAGRTDGPGRTDGRRRPGLNLKVCSEIRASAVWMNGLLSASPACGSGSGSCGPPEEREINTQPPAAAWSVSGSHIPLLTLHMWLWFLRTKSQTDGQNWDFNFSVLEKYFCYLKAKIRLVGSEQMQDHGGERQVASRWATPDEELPTGSRKSGKSSPRILQFIIQTKWPLTLSLLFFLFWIYSVLCSK